ncbi:uncharacterized mitochondrial protein AtMg00810-like [Spinacia oleracea]|uniref:Uncharacterized mitochondrial protein AtMg00810-like n=1 Tax=Spinacia oleracea TaxID=3562 RepID=A0A9R0JGX1_SPIOL|nr:uncharacterized mitochondrial protein AtMg00810-like [Spinacia oleracea]
MVFSWCQKSYAEEIFHWEGMSNCKPFPTPVDTKGKLSTNFGSPYDDSTTKYRRLDDALQYSTFTRPDISYAVQQICLFMHDLKVENMTALKRILHYIQDADWGGCPNTRRSTYGYCVFFGDNLISWSSKLQPTLSKSSVEAEYRGVANVVSESCWIRNFLLELRCTITKATFVYWDNVSSIYVESSSEIEKQEKEWKICVLIFVPHR